MSQFAAKAFTAFAFFLVTIWLTPTASAIPLHGVHVDSISAVSADSTWEVLDYQHVVVSLEPGQRYLLTLTHMCPKLAVAAKLGISASGDTVYAGFDYITADGERCLIKDISKLKV